MTFECDLEQHILVVVFVVVNAMVAVILQEKTTTIPLLTHVNYRAHNYNWSWFFVN